MKRLAGALLGLVLALHAGAALAQTQLRVGLLPEPSSLDPTTDASAVTRDITYQNIFEGLTRLDSTGAVAPDLAQSWDVSADGTTYTFHLRPFVRFQDGTSLESRQVAFTFGRLLAPDGGTVDTLFREIVAGVSAPDAMTVVVTLKQPDKGFLAALAQSGAVIVAPESVDNNRTEPIGTGPFAFVQWAAGQSLLLERNEDFWGQHPELTQVVISFPKDAASALDALQSGRIDALPRFPAATVPAALKSDPRFRLVAGAGSADVAIWNAKLSGYGQGSAEDAMLLGGVRWQE